MSFLDRFPRVTSCCFCCSLQSGVKTVSIFQLIVWFLVLVSHIYVLIIIKAPALVEAHEMRNSVLLYDVIWILFFLASFLFALLLTVGTCKEKRKLITIWLWADIVLTLFYISYTIFYDLTGGHDKKMAGDINLPTKARVFGEILLVGLTIYWWFSVNTMRMELNDSKARYRAVQSDQQSNRSHGLRRNSNSNPTFSKFENQEMVKSESRSKIVVAPHMLARKAREFRTFA